MTTPPPGQWLELIKTACAVVSAIAAVAIPFLLYILSQQVRQHDNRVEQTFRTMQELDEKISAILEKKAGLDRKYEKQGKERFDPQYITTHPEDVEDQVFRLLNLYEFICSGANRSFFDSETIETLRGNSMRATWEDYQPYIVEHRAAVGPATADAWNAFETWIKAHRASAPR